MPRNWEPLSTGDIDQCQQQWHFLCRGVHVAMHSQRLKGWSAPVLDDAEARRPRSRTRFLEGRNVIMLGCDALPGAETDANSRMSFRACLAHELAHAQRHFLGFRRPFEGLGRSIDEAETSLHATFFKHLTYQDVYDLIEDAKQRLTTERYLS